MKKILLLDDDLVILNALKLILSYKKFKVKAISKWQIVQTTIEEFTPDLIMLDIDLSGADGSEICKEIKIAKNTKHIPVILISAHLVSDEYLKACKAQGFLGKPFEMDNLLKVVNQNLN